MTAPAEIQWGIRVHGPRARMAVAATCGRLADNLERPRTGIGSRTASQPGHSTQTGTFITTATAANKSRQVVGAPPTLQVSTTLAMTTSARPPRTPAVSGSEDVTRGS